MLFQLTRRSMITACIAMVPLACAPAKGDGREAITPRQSTSTEDALQEKRALVELESLYQKAMDAQKRGDHEEAIRHFRAVLEVKNVPARANTIWGSIHYDIACSEARLGRVNDAFLSLDRAAKAGYADVEHAASDTDLESLRSDARFARALTAFRDNEHKLRIYDVMRSDSPDLGWAYLHKFENIDSPYFSELRTKYHLDAVVTGQKTEVDRQLALLSWVHNRWPHTGLSEPSHEDALTILREVEAGKRYRCVEYSVVLTQVLQAMGYPARIVGLQADGVSFGINKGHVVTEAWNNELQKWIILDGQNNGTWRQDGSFLSAAEIRQARHSNSEHLRFVLAPSTWMPVNSEPEQRAEWGRYFEHLSFSFENVQPVGKAKNIEKVDLLYPGERYELLFQGTATKNHVQTPAVEKLYPAMGRVHVSLSAESAGKPQVHLEFTNSMPWFSHYRVRENGKESAANESHFVWRLAPGKNEILISAVNTMRVEGKATSIVVDFIPQE